MVATGKAPLHSCMMFGFAFDIDATWRIPVRMGSFDGWSGGLSRWLQISRACFVIKRREKHLASYALYPVSAISACQFRRGKNLPRSTFVEKRTFSWACTANFFFFFSNEALIQLSFVLLKCWMHFLDKLKKNVLVLGVQLTKNQGRRSSCQLFTTYGARMHQNQSCLMIVAGENGRSKGRKKVRVKGWTRISQFQVCAIIKDDLGMTPRLRFFSIGSLARSVEEKLGPKLHLRSYSHERTMEYARFGDSWENVASINLCKTSPISDKLFGQQVLI